MVRLTSSGGVWRYSSTPDPVFCSIRQVDEEMNCHRSALTPDTEVTQINRAYSERSRERRRKTAG
ncbi:hypothetical protein K443DRAFT_675324 [Laccaria amethystina LaAM-08-1]|uniref:Uncharacterized protein n=1 Tax=Laccaria amethystina LaAM-08-1 TaxID=1095629 RepID=A0A0C9XU22_9AGAR|nr:hypothetical protein K443DRAFT_675324 [Laccaria amethystina LaAM-08-1]